MSELKLLPCPFCGEEAETDTCDNGGEYVCCPKCGIRFYVGHCGLVTYKDLEEAWNTRVPPNLPRVSPENLVEGRWYDFVSEGEMCRGVYASMHNRSGKMCLRTISGIFIAEGCDAIWGPIPEFELEGDA